jgi:hypothetical protein
VFLVCCSRNYCHGQVCDLNSLDYSSIPDYGSDPGCGPDPGYGPDPGCGPDPGYGDISSP